MDKSPEERFRELEDLFSSAVKGQNSAIAWESLLDTLLLLYNECNTSVLRREKNVLEFLEFGKQYISKTFKVYTTHLPLIEDANQYESMILYL